MNQAAIGKNRSNEDIDMDVGDPSSGVLSTLGGETSTPPVISISAIRDSDLWSKLRGGKELNRSDVTQLTSGMIDIIIPQAYPHMTPCQAQLFVELSLFKHLDANQAQ